jgi:hypothetical protein
VTARGTMTIRLAAVQARSAAGQVEANLKHAERAGRAGRRSGGHDGGPARTVQLRLRAKPGGLGRGGGPGRWY